MYEFHWIINNVTSKYSNCVVKKNKIASVASVLNDINETYNNALIKIIDNSTIVCANKIYHISNSLMCY